MSALSVSGYSISLQTKYNQIFPIGNIPKQCNIKTLKQKIFKEYGINTNNQIICFDDKIFKTIQRSQSPFYLKYYQRNTFIIGFIRDIKIYKLPADFFELFNKYFVNQRIHIFDDNYVISPVKSWHSKLKLVISDNIHKSMQNSFELLSKTPINCEDKNKKYAIFLMDEFSSIVCVFMNFNVSLGSQLISIGINQLHNVIIAPPKINGKLLDWNQTLCQQKITPETFLYLLPKSNMFVNICCAYLQPKPIKFSICKSWNIEQIIKTFVYSLQRSHPLKYNENITHSKETQLFLLETINKNFALILPNVIITEILSFLNVKYVMNTIELFLFTVKDWNENNNFLTGKDLIENTLGSGLERYRNDSYIFHENITNNHLLILIPSFKFYVNFIFHGFEFINTGTIQVCSLDICYVIYEQIAHQLQLDINKILLKTSNGNIIKYNEYVNFIGDNENDLIQVIHA
eukprot:536681_1